MKAFIVVGIMLTLLPGCSSKTDKGSGTGSDKENPIHRVIKSYLDAPYGERHKYVLDGARLRAEMDAHYSGIPDFPKLDQVSFGAPIHVSDGAMIVSVMQTLGNESQIRNYYVRKSGDGWLIDWPASVGLNPLTLKVIRANPPRDPITLRVLVEISDYYNFQYFLAKNTHYSLRLTDAHGDSIHGYVAKKSDLGREIYNIVKDGKTHEIILAVQYSGRESSAVDVVGLVSKSWFSR